MADHAGTISELLADALKVLTGGVTTITLKPTPVALLEMEDANFHHNSAVLLPEAPTASAGDRAAESAEQSQTSGLDVLRTCLIEAERNPNKLLFLAGHTDSSGDVAYNLDLSDLRAKNVLAALLGMKGDWVDIANKKHRVEDYKQILAWVAKTKGFPCDPGPNNDQHDAKTTVAVKSFQKSFNKSFGQSIKEDGAVGKETWGAFFDIYEEQLLERMFIEPDKLADLRGKLKFLDDGKKSVGCGEHHPIDAPEKENFRSSTNRRVEILFFDPGEKPLLDCHPGGTKCKPELCQVHDRGLFVPTHISVTPFGPVSSRARLNSRYALDRFEQFAAALEQDEFVGWASTVYGTDIPLDAYRALREDLVGKALAPPEIQLVPGGIEGRDSAYDNATRMIGVREQTALAAETDPTAAGELIVLLMHEFGHHVDQLLRSQYSKVGGDAAGEEATMFSYGVTGMHHVDTGHVPFATITQRGQTKELALDFPDFNEAVKKYLSDPKAQDEAKSGTVEFFGAGRGNPNFPKSSFGHRSIEDGLTHADARFFDIPARDEIYFGNWLRDFSQFNDPGWLRFLQNRYVNAVKPARELMTETLDLAAHQDFDPGASPSEHVAGAFHVTTAKLGVYRPEEHIDNPEGILNGSEVDPLFHGAVPPNEIAIDAKTGLKAYIATRGQNFATAADFVDRSLRGAVLAGRTVEGRRLLGQALHTLEDLFAHSNFIELTLIRLGHRSVYPWVGSRAVLTVIRNGRPQPRIPMVTGVFGSVDTGVSGASAIGEALQRPIECKAGEFSSSSVAVLKLLEAVTPDQGKAIESLFTQVNKLEKKYPAYATFLCRATTVPRDWIRVRLGTAMREQIKQLGAAEKAFFDDPFSTAPTHSQVAKDHDDHPLHVIAAGCAQSMVADVGLAVRDGWQGRLAVDAVVQRALRYLVHPDDVDVLQVSGPGQIVRQIQAFADSNPVVIGALDFRSSKARFLKGATAARERRLSEAKLMFANNDQNADRTNDLTETV